MSTLAADVSFDFSFPQQPCEPVTQPSFSFNPSLLEIPYNYGHARSSSHGSVYSLESSPSDSILDNSSTRVTTPARSPIRTHGPLLLPKIRSQDQAITPCIASNTASPPKRMRTSPALTGSRVTKFRPTHNRSFTNPEAITFNHAALSFCSQPLQPASSLSLSSSSLSLSMPEGSGSNAQLLCSPVSFTPTHETTTPVHSRRASSCGLMEHAAMDKFSFPAYPQMPQASQMTQVSAYMMGAVTTDGSSPSMQTPTLMPQSEQFMYQAPYAPRESSPLASATTMTPEPQSAVSSTMGALPTVATSGPATSLLAYLTSVNPAPSLVRTISFPLKDPHTRHFWWDVRQVRQWNGFNAASILSLPGAASLLSSPVPASFLPNPVVTQRHPETEQALHSIYSNFYIPKLNAALALSSARPLQLSLASKAAQASTTGTECMFVANVAGESSSAAAIFGGKPTARVVGLVKSFDRFNTGMRVEGNVKRVEYLRGLAHLHHMMREHGCRYGFILTEIELVFVRNGGDDTPHFGYLEVGSTQLASQHADGGGDEDPCSGPLTACLALWGLCMLAGDEALPGHAHWRSEIGAPAEGTRRKALPRDEWMPQPQLAEKRESKRVRGWVFPEDPVGRKELGKRGVRYGAC